MDVMARAAPPPGSANAGDLYVDLQSRTLWLGVDPAVDPAGFVLISDMLALQSEIAGSIVVAKDYTDEQILTRAPLSHTHTSGQIVDFTEAVTSVVMGIPGFNWVRGMILQWSGSLAEIGVGDLAGWALCDGSNGTPNLRDCFVMGAGNVAVGAKNPNNSLAIAASGAHIHNINMTTLSLAQIPQHDHTGITGYVSANHTHTFSGVTDIQGQHTHPVPMGTGGGGSGGADTDGNAPISFYLTTNPAGAHQHNFSGTTSGISANHYHGIPNEGGGQGHTHSMTGGGGLHEHNIPSSDLRNAIPYFAVAFIMKL